MNKETLRMQILAGIITESQYKAKMNEEDESTLSRDEKYQIQYNTLSNTGGLFSKEGINDFIKELPKPIPSYINSNDFSLEEWLEEDAGKFWGRVKNEKIYEPRLQKIDFVKWLEYDKIILKGANRLREIKNWKNQLLIPCFDVGTNNDFHLPQDKIVRLDATAYLKRPDIVKKEKDYKWVIASLGKRDTYLKSLSLKWELLMFCKEFRQRGLTEDEVVQKYSENWGVLSPQYTGRNDICTTGYQRNRFVYSLHAGSILLSSEKEGKTFGGPYEFDYVKSVEDNPHRVEEVAKEQREWLEKILWDKNRLHDEIKKSIL
jgi:hypothetical protein